METIDDAHACVRAMRVWLIKVGEEIPDDPGSPRLLRTGILAKHLLERGHDVTWWNATVNHQRKLQRANKTVVTASCAGYRLILLYGCTYKRNISPTRILSHIQNAREFCRLAPQMAKPDVIVCSYPTIELARAACEFANMHRIPIVVDFRDMWPAIIEGYIPTGLKWLARPLLAHWRRSLQFIVRSATVRTGITDAFVAWSIAAGGCKTGQYDRAFHLAVDPGAPDPALLAKADQLWDALGLRRTPGITQCYFGGRLSGRTDMRALVMGAMLLSAEERTRIRLVICGSGDIERELRAIAAGASHIVLPGWRSAAELQALLGRSDVGLLPYKSSPDFLASFPNKVGEYLASGLPILTGLGGLTGELLEKHGIGIFYQEGSPASAATSLRRIVSEPAALRAMAERATAVYRQHFDPRKIYLDYCGLIEELALVGPGASEIRALRAKH
jgi:glycosyltransferase involved in cell wall biosynthesis